MVKSVIVVGGGAAGWITAGLLAARYKEDGQSPISVSLVESPNIPIIGVGEGTWPTMIDTLKKLGISETEFLLKCDATFKQASKFRQWVIGEKDDEYYHPFSVPQGFDDISLVSRWQETCSDIPFAEAVGLQAELCSRKLAPKNAGLPDYSFIENHGYHLDAGKFAKLLAEHCTKNLGVRHVLADVTAVNSADDGDIASLSTRQAGDISGDLFIDCTGSAAVLIGRHYKVPFISKKDVLFIDRALAVQVPYKDKNADIESATVSTAQTAGWIWDIGLPSRRGVGHVYSSAHISEEDAKEQLKAYLRPDVEDVENLTIRALEFNPGHREKFWVRNCVAVGMAAGFIEPLEASALVMVELAAKTISLHLPASRSAMDVVAKSYNQNFLFRWERVIDFLKLHYVLSKRNDSAFWKDNRDEATIPESLKDLLTLWRHQPPANNGFLSPYDLFPAASYQYILYGMGFHTEPCHLENTPRKATLADIELKKVQSRKASVPAHLPSNRDLLQAIFAGTRKIELDLGATMSKSCMPVAVQDICALANRFPILFRHCPELRQLTGVALLGFAQDENLSNIGHEEQRQIGNAAYSSISAGDNARLMRLDELNLLEPVKLDITFQNNSAIAIRGLLAINQKKLVQLSEPELHELDQLGLRPAIQAAISSLRHISPLIDIKNQSLASAA